MPWITCTHTPIGRTQLFCHTLGYNDLWRKSNQRKNWLTYRKEEVIIKTLMSDVLPVRFIFQYTAPSGTDKSDLNFNQHWFLNLPKLSTFANFDMTSAGKKSFNKLLNDEVTFYGKRKWLCTVQGFQAFATHFHTKVDHRIGTTHKEWHGGFDAAVCTRRLPSWLGMWLASYPEVICFSNTTRSTERHSYHVSSSFLELPFSWNKWMKESSTS